MDPTPDSDPTPDPAPDPASFKKATKKLVFLSFFAYYFLKLHLLDFSKTKSHKDATKQKESRFSNLFLLDKRRIRIRTSY